LVCTTYLLYADIESPVLWARPEAWGCAVNERYGVSAFVTPRHDFGGTGRSAGVLA